MCVCHIIFCRCAVVSSIPAGESITFQCHGMEGRYINIIRPGCFKFLSVCEVEVNARPVSVSGGCPSPIRLLYLLTLKHFSEAAGIPCPLTFPADRTGFVGVHLVLIVIIRKVLE